MCGGKRVRWSTSSRAFTSAMTRLALLPGVCLSTMAAEGWPSRLE